MTNRLSRSLYVFGSLWVFASVVGVMGCPGTISDPARFFREGVPIQPDAAPADRTAPPADRVNPPADQVTPPPDNPPADRVSPPADNPPVDEGPPPPKGCDIRPLFKSKCVLCHSDASPAGKLSLEPTSGIYALIATKDSVKCQGKKLVDPKDVLMGVFWDKVSNDKPCGGDRMPPTGKPLKAAELDCIKKWLQASAGQ